MPAPVEFTDFYVAEQPSALRLAWLLTHDRVKADDLVQDAFASVMVRFDDLENPAAYLRTTLINLVRERHRRSDREEKRLRLDGASRSTSTPPPSDPLIDVIATLPLHDATGYLFRSVQQGWIDERTLREQIRARRGMHGNTRLRRFAELITSGAHSPAERLLHDLLATLDGIRYEANATIRTGGKRFVATR